MSTPSHSLTCFTNCHLIIAGELISQDLYFSPSTGLICPNYYYRTEGVRRIDLGGKVVSPGFLELQTNGVLGVHFTGLGKRKGERGQRREGDAEEDRDGDDDEEKLERVARWMVTRGVTGWYATVPTVARGRWKEILPLLRPRKFTKGASLLGAHAEGPYLHPSKAGAHNPSNFLLPSDHSPESIYGLDSLTSNSSTDPSSQPEPSIKLITLAPELPGSLPLITHLRTTYPHVTISLGHSSADYTTGLAAQTCGATALTHVFNAMAPMHHRAPGLAGLMGSIPPTSQTSPAYLGSARSAVHVPARRRNPGSVDDYFATSAPPEPVQGPMFYSLIPDGIHVHPSLLRMALRTDPGHCILITDSMELAGLPDGVYPGNEQISGRQRKVGNRVTKVKEDEEAAADNNNTAKGQAGTTSFHDKSEEETLIGSTLPLAHCVTNTISLTGCSLAEAVRCVTENVAAMMGLEGTAGRGSLEMGRRADFVILDMQSGGDGGVEGKGNGEGDGQWRVVQTWMGGEVVWDRDEG